MKKSQCCFTPLQYVKEKNKEKLIILKGFLRNLLFVQKRNEQKMKNFLFVNGQKQTESIDMKYKKKKTDDTLS